MDNWVDGKSVWWVVDVEAKSGIAYTYARTISPHIYVFPGECATVLGEVTIDDLPEE